MLDKDEQQPALARRANFDRSSSLFPEPPFKLPP